MISVENATHTTQSEIQTFVGHQNIPALSFIHIFFFFFILHCNTEAHADNEFRILYIVQSSVYTVVHTILKQNHVHELNTKYERYAEINIIPTLLV